MPSNHPHGCLCGDCRAEKSRQRYSLFDLGIDEVSFVSQGDNTGAHIVMHKNRGESEAEIEERIIKQAIAEVQAESEGSVIQTMNKRGDVVGEVQRRAEEVRKANPDMGMATARAKAWADNPDLASRYTELPAEAPPEGAQPVQKGADVLEEVEREAVAIRKAEPSLSEAQARMRAWRLNPHLADRYRAAFE